MQNTATTTSTLKEAEAAYATARKSYADDDSLENLKKEESAKSAFEKARINNAIAKALATSKTTRQAVYDAALFEAARAYANARSWADAATAAKEAAYDAAKFADECEEDSVAADDAADEAHAWLRSAAAAMTAQELDPQI
jgi:hypothetical protein